MTAPESRTARLDVLVAGSAAPQPDGTLRVTGTVSLVRDGDRVTRPVLGRVTSASPRCLLTSSSCSGRPGTCRAAS